MKAVICLICLIVKIMVKVCKMPFDFRCISFILVLTNKNYFVSFIILSPFYIGFNVTIISKKSQYAIP